MWDHAVGDRSPELSRSWQRISYRCTARKKRTISASDTPCPPLARGRSLARKRERQRAKVVSCGVGENPPDCARADPIRPTAYVPLFAHISRRRGRACCVSCLNPHARPIGRALPFFACLHPRRRGRCAAISLFAHSPLVALSNRKTGFDFLTSLASKPGDWVIDRQPPTRMIPSTDRPSIASDWAAPCAQGMPRNLRNDFWRKTRLFGKAFQDPRIGKRRACGAGRCSPCRRDREADLRRTLPHRSLRALPVKPKGNPLGSRLVN